MNLDNTNTIVYDIENKSYTTFTGLYSNVNNYHTKGGMVYNRKYYTGNPNGIYEGDLDTGTYTQILNQSNYNIIVLAVNENNIYFIKIPGSSGTDKNLYCFNIQTNSVTTLANNVNTQLSGGGSVKCPSGSWGFIYPTSDRTSCLYRYDTNTFTTMPNLNESFTQNISKAILKNDKFYCYYGCLDLTSTPSWETFPTEVNNCYYRCLYLSPLSILYYKEGTEVVGNVTVSTYIPYLYNFNTHTSTPLFENSKGYIGGLNDIVSILEWSLFYTYDNNLDLHISNEFSIITERKTSNIIDILVQINNICGYDIVLPNEMNNQNRTSITLGIYNYWNMGMGESLVSVRSLGNYESKNSLVNYIDSSF